MFNVIINTHDSYWDCDDCGYSGSEIISFNSEELGEFYDGDAAYCYGSNSGSMITVLRELNRRLADKGIIVKLKEHGDEYDKAENAFYSILRDLDWANRDIWTDEQKRIHEEYCTLDEEYEAFYREENLSKYYEQFGVSLSFTSSYDEFDEQDQYYEDTFDSGYSTDESYDSDEDK
ncbi:hypothetical protein pEaSNUABM12_00165 [Erwinia phage pEa_SNUABM_12]|uniref:Uncharacterized protein n=1 Tax=Erwinia phage pEa_SNUABM_12 TaxID=2768773 RepID=A0A7L8ZL31_9CAUD|nr:hypothetical protein pEaSNUABM12_00165 [Erwinia phage pEa_SNUABM_12]